jgi:hypothetical protein
MYVKSKLSILILGDKMLTEVPGLKFCSPPLATSTQSWAENIAHSAMYAYKGGERNFSPGTSVGILKNEKMSQFLAAPPRKLRLCIPSFFCLILNVCICVIFKKENCSRTLMQFPYIMLMGQVVIPANHGRPLPLWLSWLQCHTAEKISWSLPFDHEAHNTFPTKQPDIA